MNFKQKIKRKLLLIAFMVAALTLYNILPVFAEKEGPSNKKTILIDPGHGGYDGGAEGKSGIKEKDINLIISLKLRNKLKAEGYEVVMTREEDKSLIEEGVRNTTKKAQDMANRCKIKHESNADLFISIHQNHFQQNQYYGGQVWYSNSKQSETLAHILQGNLKTDLIHDKKRIEKPANNAYKILACNDIMPSVLVECGFLSNYEEEKRLLSEEYQQKIVDSIVKSINQYFETNKNL